MAEVFISYKSEERELIVPIARRLEELGIGVWYDAQIQVGSHFDAQIEAMLKAAKAVIVCWSAQSVRSDWVKREATIADYNETIVPIFLDNTAPPDTFARREGARLFGWDGKRKSDEWTLVIATLQRLLGRNDLMELDAALGEKKNLRLAAHFRPERTERARRRLLSLDACGARVMLQLRFLDEIERVLRARHGNPKFVLADYFDLIGGTSLGALVAALLAAGHSVSDAAGIVSGVLSRWYPAKGFGGGVLVSKFDSRTAASDLRGLFGDMTVVDKSLRTGLALCLRNVTRNRPWVVTNNPVWSYYDQNKDFLLADVVVACTARPGLPDPMQSKLGVTVDGMFGGLGNPAMELLHTVVSDEHGLRWSLGGDKVIIVSVGGGAWRRRNEDFARSSGDKANVATMVAQSLGFDTVLSVDRSMRMLGRGRDGERVAPELEPLFEYRRYDCDLDAEYLSQMLSRTVTAKEARSIQGYEKALDRSASKLLDEVAAKATPQMVTPSDFPPLFDVQYEPAASY